MARTALGDRTNIMHPAPVGKLGPMSMKKNDMLPVHSTPQRQSYATTYSLSPASYQHDPYAMTPSPVPMHMAHSPMPAVQVPDLQPYPEPSYYDYPQEPIPQHPPQLLPGAPTGSPTAPVSPTQHYAPTWQIQTDVHMPPTMPTSAYYQPQPSADPPLDISGIAVVKFRFERESEYSTTFPVKVGDHVLVNGDRGVDMGVVASFKQTDDTRENKLVRLAADSEIHTYLNEIPTKEKQVVKEASEIISNAGLRMEITDAEFQFDMGKLTLFYTAPTPRIDWRPVLNDLFRKFQCRIWFRKSIQGQAQDN
eukprot:TRINITY_DN38596_c0_g1_i1.p1 TRINITY_DN38596_c0_g1~~TRINITY_DN38596_c0_g1_i1.p1  ORF type:complete len:308 (+),score=45.53 TRINITY_DN38596_c0_g1_i1:48-971(+)